MEKRNERTVGVEITNTDGSYKRKLRIVINTMLPLIYFGGNESEKLITSVSAEDTFELPAPTAKYNKLVDLSDTPNPDRFTLIGICKSISTHMNCTVWHDALYKDILVLPDLNDFGTNENVEVLKNKTLTVEGSLLGYRPTSSHTELSLTMSYNEESVMEIESVTAPTSNTSVSHFLPGLKLENSVIRHKHVLSNSDEIRVDLSSPIQLLTLGSTASILGSTVKLDTALIYPKSVRQYTMMPIGEVELSKITFCPNF